MSFLQGLKGISIPRERLLVLLPVVVAVFLVLGYLFYAQLVIMPGLRLTQARANDLAAARRQLRDAQAVASTRPDQLRQNLATAQTTFSQTASLFMSESQAARAVNNLYDYARETDVEIVELQAVASGQVPQAVPAATAPPANPTPPPPTAVPGQPTPTAGQTQPPAPPSAAQTGAYEAKSFHLQVLGPATGLLDFVADIKEAAFPTFLISNVNLAEAEGQTTLTMDITFYTSPYAPDNPLPTAPATPAAVATDQRTPTSASAGTYLVRPTNWPTEWPWPPTTGTALPPTSPADAQPAATPGPTLAPTTPVPTPLTRYTVYTVRRGDTLYSIARRYGTTSEAIMAANGLSSTSIRVGQQLKIPRP